MRIGCTYMGVNIQFMKRLKSQTLVTHLDGLAGLGSVKKEDLFHSLDLCK